MSTKYTIEQLIKGVEHEKISEPEAVKIAEKDTRPMWARLECKCVLSLEQGCKCGAFEHEQILERCMNHGKGRFYEDE